MPAARDPEVLLEAARLYYLENLSQQRLPSSWAPAARTSPGCSPTRCARASSRSGSTTRQAASRELEARARGRPSACAKPGSPSARAPSVRRRGTRSERRPPSCSRQRQGPDDGGAVVGPRAAGAWSTPTTADHDYAAHLVQLVGGLSSISNEISGPELVRELASRLGASYRYLHARRPSTTARPSA